MVHPAGCCIFAPPVDPCGRLKHVKNCNSGNPLIDRLLDDQIRKAGPYVHQSLKFSDVRKDRPKSLTTVVDNQNQLPILCQLPIQNSLYPVTSTHHVELPANAWTRSWSSSYPLVIHIFNRLVKFRQTRN